MGSSHHLSLDLTRPDGVSQAYSGFSYGDCQLDNVPLTMTGVYTLTVDGLGH